MNEFSNQQSRQLASRRDAYTREREEQREWVKRENTMATTTAMTLLLEQLKAEAIQGQIAIENGDWARCELKDLRFAEMVAAAGFDEEPVIEAMASSPEWDRGYNGFNLTKRYTD